ncbi:MAG: sugar ABC transporter permease [Actinomycetaceae bacterium]|nr:sugar ABC transporter permease [Actinomycetaceae bacterium]
MKSHRWYTPYILLSVPVTWVLVFSLWPFLNTVILAFTDARPLRAAKFVGLENFRTLFADPQFIYAITTCLIYVVVCVPLLTLLPLVLALLVEKKIPGISAFRTAYYFPVVASVVVVGIIWAWIFDSRGVINQSLEAFGLIDQPVNFLVDRWWLIATAILLTVWKGLGYYMVVYLAALGNVTKDLHEAAAIDGANGWRRFWSITVPGVRGAMVLIAALISVSAMRIFSEIYVLSNGTGGPGGQAQSIVMMVQQVGSGLGGRLGYASAISVVLFFLTIGPLSLVGFLNYGSEIKTFREHRAARKRAKEALARVEAGNHPDSGADVGLPTAMAADSDVTGRTQ